MFQAATLKVESDKWPVREKLPIHVCCAPPYCEHLGWEVRKSNLFLENPAGPIRPPPAMGEYERMERGAMRLSCQRIGHRSFRTSVTLFLRVR
jgi:hypothetical protein